jgi:MFS family permease
MSAGGSILILFGYVCASFSKHLWQLILSQGIIVGIGGALLYNPIMMIAPEYFSQKVRGKATGLISAGAGVGGLAYAPIISLLIDKVGICGTFQCVGIFTGLTGLFLVAALAPPPRPCARRTFLPNHVRKDPIFYLAIVGGFAASVTALIPYGFGPEFSTLLKFNTKTAAIQLSVLNGVGTPARILWGHLRDKIGSQNALILVSAVLAFSNFMWLGAAEENGRAVWWGFLVIWGIGTSGFGTIVAPYILDLFDNEVYFGILAVVNVARGIGSVIGTPLAGAIVGKGGSIDDDGRYFRGLISFNGAMLIVTVVTSVVARVLDGRRRGWKLVA